MKIMSDDYLKITRILKLKIELLNNHQPGPIENIGRRLISVDKERWRNTWKVTVNRCDIFSSGFRKNFWWKAYHSSLYFYNERYNKKFVIAYLAPKKKVGGGIIKWKNINEHDKDMLKSFKGNNTYDKFMKELIKDSDINLGNWTIEDLGEDVFKTDKYPEYIKNWLSKEYPNNEYEGLSNNCNVFVQKFIASQNFSLSKQQQYNINHLNDAGQKWYNIGWFISGCGICGKCEECGCECDENVSKCAKCAKASSKCVSKTVCKVGECIVTTATVVQSYEYLNDLAIQLIKNF
jgi:hypothetical protein